MDSKNTTTDNTTTQPSPRPARRSGRDRKKTPLVASFKDSIVGYVDQAPASEVQDLSDQLQAALGAVANGGDVAASCIGRVQSVVPTTTSAAVEKTSASNDNNNNNNNNRVATNSLRQKRGASMSIEVESALFRRMSGDEYYTPKSSSRRNSGAAGSALAMSMKEQAQQALLELGEISDDEEEEIMKGIVRGLENISEDRSFRIVNERADSQGVF